MSEEEKRAYEILYEKIIFVDKYRMLKPHWIKFHNYIEKLQKENEEYKLLNANIEKSNRIIEGKEDYIPKEKIRELIGYYKNEMKSENDLLEQKIITRKDYERRRSLHNNYIHILNKLLE